MPAVLPRVDIGSSSNPGTRYGGLNQDYTVNDGTVSPWNHPATRFLGASLLTRCASGRAFRESKRCMLQESACQLAAYRRIASLCAMVSYPLPISHTRNLKCAFLR